MKKCEKELKVKTLRLEYESIKRDYFAFLPSCQLRCGLLQNLSCGRKHKTQLSTTYAQKIIASQYWKECFLHNEYVSLLLFEIEKVGKHEKV